MRPSSPSRRVPVSQRHHFCQFLADSRPTFSLLSREADCLLSPLGRSERPARLSRRSSQSVTALHRQNRYGHPLAAASPSAKERSLLANSGLVPLVDVVFACRGCGFSIFAQLHPTPSQDAFSVRRCAPCRISQLSGSATSTPTSRSCIVPAESRLRPRSHAQLHL